jgi:hypothetical protein
MRRLFPIGFLFGLGFGAATEAAPSGSTKSVEQAARQARDIPVFDRTGNFNSLFGRKNSLFARAGNFGGTASNHWAFRNGFSEFAGNELISLNLSLLPGNSDRARPAFLGDPFAPCDRGGGSMRSHPALMSDAGPRGLVDEAPRGETAEVEGAADRVVEPVASRCASSVPPAGIALKRPVPQPQSRKIPGVGDGPMIGEESGTTSTIPPHWSISLSCAKAGTSRSGRRRRSPASADCRAGHRRERGRARRRTRSRPCPTGSHRRPSPGGEGRCRGTA